MFETESGLALEATSRAAQVIAEAPVKGVRKKGAPRDLVTDVDVRVEQQLVAALASSGHAVLSEELAPNAALPADAPFWAIDPIDGTVNWVSGLSAFGVSVGLCRLAEPGRPQFLAGAVSMPKTREHFFTHAETAFLNGTKLAPGDASLEDSLLAASFSALAPEGPLFEKTYGSFGRFNHRSRGVLRTGSAAVQICYAAAGRYQVAYGLGVQLWDVAGALAVARRAGLTIQCRLRDDSTRLDFVAGVPTAAEAVIRQLQEEDLCRF